MSVRRAAWMAWLALGVIAGPASFPAAAQNSAVPEFKTLRAWSDTSCQKPLRGQLSLNGAWSVTSPQFPAVGSVVLPSLFPPGGEFTCSRDVELDSAFLTKRLRLTAAGMNYRSQVLLNGHLLGAHEGGFTPFSFDINPERLLPGRKNSLRLVLDTRLQPLTTVPARLRPQASRFVAGVFGNLFIETLPDLAIDSVQCATVLESSGSAATVRVRTSLSIRDKLPSPPPPPPTRGRASREAYPEPYTVVAELYDSTGTQRLAGNMPLVIESFDNRQPSFTLEFRVDKPRLWSPANPSLYRLRVAVMQGNAAVDEWWESVGLRQLQWQGNTLSVNGQPTLLRGVDWMPRVLEESITDTAAYDGLVRRVVEWGGNLIRVVGQCAPLPLVEACDRQGVFVLEELPAYHLTPAHLAQARFQPAMQTQLAEMMVRDRNRPSLLAWGLATSTLLPERDRHMYQQLREAAKHLDDRALYVVADHKQVSSWQPIADVVVLDAFERDVVADLATIAPKVPVLGRFGHSLVSSFDESAQPDELADQQLQAARVKNALEQLNAKAGTIAGYVVCALEDWQVDEPLLRAGGQPDPFIYRAGLCTLSGEPRLAFQVTQAVHRGVRGPVLPPEEAVAKNPEAYTVVGIGVVVVMVFLLNRDRRLRGNLRRLFVHPHGFYVDIVENRKVAPALTLLVALVEGCIVAVLLSAFLFANRHSLLLDNLLSLLVGDAVRKAKLIWLVWHPRWFILLTTLAYVLVGLGLVVLMRVLAFVFGRRVNLPQLITFVFWASTNILLLGVLAPFFYGLLVSHQFIQPLIFGVLVVAVWWFFRLLRGMRVLYTLSYFKTLILFALLFGGIGLSVYVYYDRSQALWDYAGYYWTLLTAR